jgi:hypothetical protein
MSETDVEFRGKVRGQPAVLVSDTEWDAAAKQDKRGDFVTSSAVLEILRRHAPLTHEDIHAEYQAKGGNRTVQRIRTVTKELVVAGTVVVADSEGVTSNGGDAQRWKLAEQ